MNCPYCLNAAEWVENKEIYGKNYGKSVMIWLCRPCDAYVGCHNNTRKPLGTMANKETRAWRKRAHEAFDPLWKNGKMNRDKAYGLLQRKFGFQVHIGESDVEMCQKIIAIAGAAVGIPPGDDATALLGGKDEMTIYQVIYWCWRFGRKCGVDYREIYLAYQDYKYLATP